MGRGANDTIDQEFTKRGTHLFAGFPFAIKIGLRLGKSSVVLFARGRSFNLHRFFRESALDTGTYGFGGKGSRASIGTFDLRERREGGRARRLKLDHFGMWSRPRQSGGDTVEREKGIGVTGGVHTGDVIERCFSLGN